MDELVKRLREPVNWLQQGAGPWKDTTSRYDRTPYEAADAIEALTARAEAAERELRRINAAFAIKGGNEHSPTLWAYEQATKALDKHKARAEAAEARVKELVARLAAEKHVFFENVPVPACECGMTGPCMWSECKSPMLPSIRALKSDPERG